MKREVVVRSRVANPAFVDARERGQPAVHAPPNGHGPTNALRPSTGHRCRSIPRDRTRAVSSGPSAGGPHAEPPLERGVERRPVDLLVPRDVHARSVAAPAPRYRPVVMRDESFGLSTIGQILVPVRDVARATAF